MRLSNGGNLTVSGSVTENSDIRLKNDINIIETPLNTVKQLRGVTYKWNDESRNDGHKQHGFIAQEVEEILPDLVFEVNGFKSISYSKVTPILVEAVKEQQNQIDELKNQIDELKKQINGG